MAVAAMAALSIAAGPVLAGPEACPAQVEDHLPKAPQGTLNLGPIKDLLLQYHQEYYDIDVAAVFESAQRYVEQNADKAKKPALVLDIDETSLTNWPNLIADDFGFIVDGPCDMLPAGPCGFNQWILKGSARAIEPARKLFEAAKAKGVAVIFITGRADRHRDITILNLDHAGYEGWTELRTRPARNGLPTVQDFKTAERAKVEAEGYTIIANVGDQMSDIEGEHSGCRFKVPNPFYFIR
jgi:predicted secreted acid phosphatase